MKLKKWWERRKYWQKGGIIAILIQIIFFVIGAITFIGFQMVFPNATTLMRTLATPLAFLMIIAFFPSVILIEFNLLSAGNDILHIIFSVIIYFILGALIGFVIQKVRKK